MGESEQILDVKYGNFSCRLEGFTDSVETMKTVVSFFHDLAGHDRFMDVAPQAPDMTVLAELTKEQLGSEVDVTGEGNRLSLRLRKDNVEEDLAEDVAALEDELETDTAPEEEDAHLAGDAAEAADPHEGENAPEVADVSEAEDAPDMDGTPETETETETEENQDVQSDLQDDLDYAAIEEITTEDDDVSGPIDHDDSVTDKLERIRAVADGADEDETYAEDLTEAEPEAPQMNPLAQRLADLAKRSSKTRILDTSEVYSESSLGWLDNDDGVDGADTSEDGGIQEEASEEELAPDNSFDETLEDAIAELDDDGEPLEDASEIEETLDAVAADEALLSAADLVEEENASLEGESASEEMTAEDDNADTAEDESSAPASNDLSPLVLTYRDVASQTDDIQEDDDDFDLGEEVAKVEAEIAARQGNEVARHGLPRSVDDAMSRILSQTNQHLDQPESRRHRDAFAQLKAAVAATEAARQLGDEGAQVDDPDAAFKDDLGAHDAEEKNQAEAGPPLKLVKNETNDSSALASKDTQEPSDKEAPVATSSEAETPLDTATKEPKPLDAASARLRSIADLKEAPSAPHAAGFAEYAKTHGATELADKLEAAGAYICFVEGEDDFSRPQVMKMVQAATSEEITREDGLRCFGRLLRQSKLTKLSNGRFQVSENTQYRPDGEKAAQG